MHRRGVLIALALASAGALSLAAGAAPGIPPTAHVTGVRSGDTVQVRLTNGKRQKLHVLGISTPPSGSCFAKEALAATRALALNNTVKLSGTGPAAYVTLPDGTDLGRQLLTTGNAQIASSGKAFSRLASYIPVQQDAETANRGMWGKCAADLSVVLAATPSAAAVGDRITYTATITNAGPLAALDVDLDVRAPQGNPFDTAAGVTEHATCLPKGWYAACTFNSIPAKGTASAQFAVDAKKEGRASAAALVRISGCISSACGNRPLHDAIVANDRSGAITSIVPQPPPGQPPAPPAQVPVNHWVVGGNCDPHYPTVCIAPPPPDFDCADLSFREFEVRHDTPTTPDPHSLDNNFDGIGCQFDDY